MVAAYTSPRLRPQLIVTSGYFATTRELIESVQAAWVGKGPGFAVRSHVVGGWNEYAACDRCRKVHTTTNAAVMRVCSECGHGDLTAACGAFATPIVGRWIRIVRLLPRPPAPERTWFEWLFRLEPERPDHVVDSELMLCEVRKENYGQVAEAVPHEDSAGRAEGEREASRQDE